MRKILISLLFLLAATPLFAGPDPGCKSPEFRQLDFWVGDWNVQANGKQAGTSSVQLILDGCVLLENWTGAGGSNGKSFNIYNSATKTWQQFWVDNSGGTILFTGKFENGNLIYKSESQMQDGKSVLGRMTFSPMAEKKVHQVWEQSSDGGKTWNVAFDGIYSPK